MRRPAPPPPSEVVELDYGSADTPSASQALEVRTNEEEAAAAHVPPTAGRGRKLLAYDTDDFDAILPPPSTPSAGDMALNASQDLDYGSSQHNVSNAVAGPSSPSCQQAASFKIHDNSFGGTNVGTSSHTEPWFSKTPQNPPPPTYPPPVLPQNPDQHFSPHSAYDPSAPEFRPNFYPLAPPILPTESELYYTPSAPQSFHASTEGSYAQPTGSEAMSAAYDPLYDPQAPYHSLQYSASPHDYLYPAHPPVTSSYPGYYPSNAEFPYATSYTPQIHHFQDRRLLKQQKKKEKKLRKREKKQAARSAAYTAHHASHDVASSSASAIPFMHDEDVAWIEDGKAQAVAMIRELHTRGVPPQRLTERGVPLHMIEACCVELGISAQGHTRPEADATPTQQATLPTDRADGAGKKDQVSTTPAEDELLAKQEQGIALTPLEELRRKVLSSRLAKVAAASSAAAEASSTVASIPAATPSAAPSFFDRTSTSGETDTLLSQIGESIRSLMRPSHETSATAPDEGASFQSGPSSSRKRSYHDVDAVDHEDASTTADLAGGANVAAPSPLRRQRISYADTFSRAAETPSGEVDLNAPVPELADVAFSVAESSRATDAVSRRRRPVAADFDTVEYSPQIVCPNRFVDVPSGLNTVVDLSDDESEEDEMDALEEATGWKSAQLDVDMREILLLRQKTATEHYDNFCALNGLKPVGKSITPLQDSAARVIEASDVSTPGGSVSKKSLLAQVAASNAASLGSSTPSREDLLRKELEIKQLMRKIQMMEERKSRQQTATPSPSVSPMPSRYLVPGVISQAQLSNTASSEVLTTPVQIGIGEPFPSAKAPLQEESNAQQQPVPGGSTSGMRLDPALQKQRENLLALLANKRRNANAGLGEATAKPANNGVENEEQEDALVASKREDSNGASVGSGSSSISANDDKVEEIQERKENSPQPSVVSRYRPLVPSLFQSVASKFRSYLPPSLGFTVASTSSTSGGDERTSVKWCPRKADGGECADESCSQRHVREFDSDM
ncbi:uncharacterized protein SPSC_04582 [Sporisorium scitamineum]|uniref:Zinc-finger domain-containing protein n=1 Tax=Sporisorium scitamineum TaxID=49012 RepID=A0A127ZF69_9BASI|nr:uncharacterized protein SPSC_04582 [Sporisorium scitamineum]